ncbi:methylenetetrahydrofolate reductase C-terminal domain-containing protein [Lapillicoccus sp.]|uniref:methylenetetrahydrofolate reductase C-terminal domain-containing protein n=1 Tax=Lapillicoccus sp. TaxID=1909287 RepID=UPI0025FAC9A6|nr:methylenetetrahydrofolate reductase C-terminal domain-containing protein [Lapillicoccus sp.]
MLAACPKHMEHGPCGGVALDGTCEVAPEPCVFLDRPTVRWDGAPATGDRRPPSSGTVAMRDLLATRQVVVADLAARPLDAASIEESVQVLRGHVDAVLTGDSPRSRVQFPPAYRAMLVQRAGMTTWAGLTSRDRNRVALEAELAALAHVGVAGVHCVTGDHPSTGSRSDATPVFDLDSTRVAALAAVEGHLVSVAEAPASPPVERRAERLLEKQRAGAEFCFVNHAGGVGPVRRFIGEAQDLGVTTGFIPCVPVVIDPQSAELLRSFTSLVLPPGFLDRILGASDPAHEGVAAAVELALGLLALDGVVGVDLSGGSGPGSEVRYCEAFAEIGRALAPALR